MTRSPGFTLSAQRSSAAALPARELSVMASTILSGTSDEPGVDGLAIIIDDHTNFQRFAGA